MTDEPDEPEEEIATCPNCGLDMDGWDEVCNECEMDEDDLEMTPKVCPHCDGTGKEHVIGLGSRCKTCDGSGEV